MKSGLPDTVVVPRYIMSGVWSCMHTTGQRRDASIVITGFRVPVGILRTITGENKHHTPRQV